MSFNIEYAVVGKIAAPSGWLHPSSNTETHELIFCASGEIYIGQGFERFSLKSGEAAILPAGTRRYGFRESDTPSTIYWAHFSGELGTLPRKSTPDISRTVRLFEELIMYSRSPEYDLSACTCALSLIMYELMRSGAVSEDAPYAKIFEICQWIGENAHRQLRVSDVATQFSYNEDYINRMFKVHYKPGLKSYIDAVRIKKIRELLLCTDKMVKDIAAECGFENAKSFQKFFKYHEGVSAQGFRELYFGSSAKKPSAE